MGEWGKVWEWRERERVCVCGREGVRWERVRWKREGECGKIGRWEWGMWFEGKGKMVGWEREPEWGDSKVWGEREVEVSEERVKWGESGKSDARNV